MRPAHAKRLRGPVWNALALLLAIACAGSRGTDAGRSSAARDPKAPLHCIQVWPEARYRNYGYDHIVHIYNGCSASATCTVSTNVAPQAIKVRIAVRQKIEVLTYRGSPSQEFRVNSSCELDN